MESRSPNRGLFFFALLNVLAVLLVIVSGAQVTAQRPTAVFSVLTHRGIADPAGLLVLILSLWVIAKPLQPILRGLGAAALLIVIGEIFLGRAANPTSSAVGFFHAILGHLLLVITGAIATLTSPSWNQPPVGIADRGWPPLRSFAALTGALVGIQVMLGAAFRHDLLGVLWHIVGALLLALFLLGLGMLVLNLPVNAETEGAQRNPLRTPAILVLVTGTLQLALGMTLISLSDAAMRAPGGIAMTMIHTANGALTLMLTVVITVLARRHMKAKV